MVYVHDCVGCIYECAEESSLGGGKNLFWMRDVAVESSNQEDEEQQDRDSIILKQIIELLPFDIFDDFDTVSSKTLTCLSYFHWGKNRWMTPLSWNEKVPIHSRENALIRIRIRNSNFSSSSSPYLSENDLQLPEGRHQERESSFKDKLASFPTNIPSFSRKDGEVLQKKALAAASIAAKTTQEAGKLFSSWAKKGLSMTKEVVQDQTISLSSGFPVFGSKSSDIIKLNKHKVRIDKKIGDGGFSEVFLVSDLDSKESYALKRCLVQTEETRQMLESEIRLHQTIEHPNVLSLIDYHVGEKLIEFLFPLCTGGSVFDLVIHGNMSEDVALMIFADVCKGVQAIHEVGFLHRDIKPHNVLLSTRLGSDVRSARPIVMDLGSSCPKPLRIVDRKTALMIADEASALCSAPYRAPELYEPEKGTEIDEAADVWSLGCTLYAMTIGQGYGPFEDRVQGVQKLAILNGTLKFPEDSTASDLLKSIISRCIVREPDMRIKLDEIIQMLS